MNTNSNTGFPGIAKQFFNLKNKELKNLVDVFYVHELKVDQQHKINVKIAFHGDRSGKLRSSNCFVNCDKEKLAKDIAARFGTIKKNYHHFWLTQNGVGIFNYTGIAGLM